MIRNGIYQLCPFTETIAPTTNGAAIAPKLEAALKMPEAKARSFFLETTRPRF